MRIFNRIRPIALAAGALGIGLATAAAQDVNQYRAATGISRERVADVQDTPPTAPARVSTAPDSLAMPQHDSANAFSIGAGADAHFAKGADGWNQLQLARGSVTWTITAPTSTYFEVVTPSVSVRSDRRGVYRISVNDTGETLLTTRSGRVEVYTPRGSQSVAAGKMMIAHGDRLDPEFRIVDAPPVDLPTELAARMKEQCEDDTGLQQCLDAMEELAAGSEASAFAILKDGQDEATIRLYTAGRERTDFWEKLLDAVGAEGCSEKNAESALRAQLDVDALSLRSFLIDREKARRASDPWVKSEWTAKALSALATKPIDSATVRNYVACRKNGILEKTIRGLRIGELR